MKKVFLLLLMSGCATDPVISYRAGVRANAGWLLGRCLQGQGRYSLHKKVCLQEQTEYCLSKGLEANCGVDELWVK